MFAAASQSNWTLVVVGIVVILFYKGYLKVPDFLRRRPIAQQQTGPATGQTAQAPSFLATPDSFADEIDRLSGRGSYVLGTAYAKAKHKEAMDTVAYQAFSHMDRKLQELFTAPFSVPAPAGPSQTPVAPAMAQSAAP